MLLNTAEFSQFNSLEEIVEYDSQFPYPTTKAYFEDVIVSTKSQEMTASFVKTLDDFFLTSTGTRMIMNTQYLVEIHNKTKEQPDYCLLERDGFRDVHTTICISNNKTKCSFIIDYDTQSEMIGFSLQRNKHYSISKPVSGNDKELAGFVEMSTFFTLAFCEMILSYLENHILDLSVTGPSFLKH